MIIKIENEKYSAEINETGAELYSFKKKSDGTEYIWQGDEKYWSSRSPIMFPVCGRLYGGKIISGGKEYAMERHGFVRRAQFSVCHKSAAEVGFLYKSNEDTKKVYPFDFEFKMIYTLDGDALKITFAVKNAGDGKMPFSFGAHPAFNVPFGSGGKFEEHYLEFGENTLKLIEFSENFLCTGELKDYALTDKKLYLKHELFDNDALFFKADCGSVKLRSEKTSEYISVNYRDMTCVGLWHKPHSDAPYVCIEPWHGSPSFEGKTDDIFKKQDVIILEPQTEYKNTYEIEICR